MSTPPLPVLFVSHGSPMFALEPGESGPALTRWAASIERPRAVLIMSPHWMESVPTVMTSPRPDTWHDFGGFPPALYQLRYPAPGAPEVAHEVLELLARNGIAAQADAQCPFDHGAWVPLMHLFPQADVPVVQVALPARADPAQLLALGRALAPLRERGMLLVGSGSFTHNLRELLRDAPPSAQATWPYVNEFSRWIEEAIVRSDVQAMQQWIERAPQARRAHPSDEHFRPIFFALGAGGWGQTPAPALEWLSREVTYGALAMDSFALSRAPVFS